MQSAGSSHTDWVLIGEAAGQGAGAKQALEQLVRRYWPAVYAFARQSGYTVDDSADLTQSFVCEVVLENDLFKNADPARGRFRTLLLNALQNFIRSKYRHERAQRRHPPQNVLQFDERQLTPAATIANLTPEQAFSVQWHATLLRRVLERVRATCVAAGLEAHWRVFEARVVKPVLFGDQCVTYPKLVELLELDDAGQAANMMVTVKRRFVRALIEEVGCTVNDPQQIEQEIRALLSEVESHQ